MINVTPMATKKKIAIKYAQKGIRKRLKHYTIKKSTKHQEYSKAGNEG